MSTSTDWLIPEWDLADRMTKSLRVSSISVQEMADYLCLRERHAAKHLRCAMHCAMVISMPTHTDSELIGSAEVCRILDRHQATIGRWVAQGRLTPAHKLPGKNGAYLFRRSDVEELAKESA